MKILLNPKKILKNVKNCGKQYRDFNAAVNLKGESIRLARSEFMPMEDCLSRKNKYILGDLRNPMK
ncbi:MAG: hypothetical protein LBG43_01940 [Treponema sp.]|jgi:hypothetical protein|nr:hypothetical protein [Treponema sp.]